MPYLSEGVAEGASNPQNGDLSDGRIRYMGSDRVSSRGWVRQGGLINERRVARWTRPGQRHHCHWARWGWRIVEEKEKGDEKRVNYNLMKKKKKE